MPNHQEHNHQGLLLHTEAIRKMQEDSALIDRALSILDQWNNMEIKPNLFLRNGTVFCGNAIGARHYLPANAVTKFVSHRQYHARCRMKYGWKLCGYAVKGFCDVVFFRLN
jgi:hypothetical protein